MATVPLLMCFPQPIGRGMSFRIYRLAEKRHKVRGEKRAFAQTITTPGRRYRGGWPGRNGAGLANGKQHCCAPTTGRSRGQEFERETLAISKGAQEFEHGEVFPRDLVHLFAVMLGHGLNDAVAGANIVKQEVAVGMKLLSAEGGRNGERAAVEVCAGGSGRKRLNVAGIAAHFVE